jgi:hypothetical protein
MPIDIEIGPSDGKLTAITAAGGALKQGAAAIVDLATKPSA